MYTVVLNNHEPYFMIMKHPLHKVRPEEGDVTTREQRSRHHQDVVFLALQTLGETSVPKIKALLDIWAEEQSGEQMDGGREVTISIQNRRKLLTMTERGIWDLIKKMELKGLVKRRILSTKVHLLSLTEAGREIQLYSSFYGNRIFNGMERTFTKSKQMKSMADIVAMFGIFTFYICLKNTAPNSTRLLPHQFNESKERFVKDALVVDRMFSFFKANYLPKVKTLSEHWNRLHMLDKKQHAELLQSFKTQYPDYYKSLVEAEERFFQHVPSVKKMVI
jgi:DNA-binding MarR family transcriptional regulator